MKKIYLFLSVFLLLSATSQAILPPLYQGVNEIKALMMDQELGKKLHSGELIMVIQKNEQGYLITTNYHHLQVDIVYEKTGKIGPAEFKLHFHEPIDLE